MRSRIRIVSGPSLGETLEVAAGKLIIGREEDCHLRPDSDFISRHHCALLLDDYTLRIRDLGSKNGTFVNGSRIKSGETILSHGDRVSIGEMTFVIDLDQESFGEEAPAPPASLALDGTELDANGELKPGGRENSEKALREARSPYMG